MLFQLLVCSICSCNVKHARSLRCVIIKSIKTGSVCYFHKHLTYSRTRSSKIPTSIWTYPACLTRRSISWTRCLRMFVDYIKIASKISGHKTFQYIQRYINTLWRKQLFVVNSWILILIEYSPFMILYSTIARKIEFLFPYLLNIYTDHDIISRWFRFLPHFNLLMHHYEIFMFNIKLMMTAFSNKHSDIIWHTLPNLLFILATDKWISRNQFLRSLPLYKYCEWQANDNYCL